MFDSLHFNMVDCNDNQALTAVRKYVKLKPKTSHLLLSQTDQIVVLSRHLSVQTDKPELYYACKVPVQKNLALV